MPLNFVEKIPGNIVSIFKAKAKTRQAVAKAIISTSPAKR